MIKKQKERKICLPCQFRPVTLPPIFRLGLHRKHGPVIRLDHPSRQTTLGKHSSSGKRPDQSEENLVTLHIVRWIQFVNTLSVFRFQGLNLNVRMGFLVRFLHVIHVLRILAHKNIPYHPLDRPCALVKVYQLLGDIVMNEIDVKGLRPVDQNILLPQ